MPQRMWKVVCECWTGGMGGPTCSHCGHPNEYVGWQYGTHERMANSQYRFGVHRIGPHRQLADELIRPHIKQCAHCDGEGLLTDRTTDTWTWCAACEATGLIYDCDLDTIRRIRERIESEFPGAVSSPVHPLRRAAIFLEIATGEIVGPEEQVH